MDDSKLDLKSYFLLIEERLVRLEEKISTRMEGCYQKFAQIDRLDERVKELEDLKKEIRHWLFFVVVSLLINFAGWVWAIKSNGVFK